MDVLVWIISRAIAFVVVIRCIITAKLDETKRNRLKFCIKIDCVKLKDAKDENYNTLLIDVTHAGDTTHVE